MTLEPAIRAEPADGNTVDLDRYPIDDLDAPPGRELVGACRAGLLADGVCSLPGFVTAGAVRSMVASATEGSGRAWATDQMHTVYFEPVDESVGWAHPGARQVRSAKKGLAYDLIPPAAPLRQLYESEDLTSFIAAVMGLARLYRSADPLDALQITRFDRGDELGWHFDRSEFSVTVMLQPSDGGGHFDYFPGLRSDRDQNEAGVQRVLDGDELGMVRLSAAPGTLAVFRGRHALHRVTPVEGTTPRINSVLSYGQRPDMRLNELTARLFYGRIS